MTVLTYAIGDVHGCATLLSELVDRIRDDSRGRPFRLVLIGDYIDKGPQSAATIELVMELERMAPGRTICLMGNHEAELLASLVDEEALHRWLSMGGSHVLEEYGVASADRLPRDVLDWLARLALHHEDAGHYFVHAGLDPDRPLDDQSDHDRLTMRGAFLARDHDFGLHVVHGHTPQTSGLPEIRPFRTNIDTSAFSTGVLTAAVLDPERSGPIRFLQTGR